MATPTIYLGNTPIQTSATQPDTGAYVQMLGEPFYRITNVDQMPPFFMSLVSGADHWLFIASNGGLTAGRGDANSALFPYETEDKITAHHELTGSKTVLRVTRNGRTQLWEPFTSIASDTYRCQRHLYKNIPGSTLIFEEVNHDLRLTLRIAWRTGDRFGFVRTAWLQNDGADCAIALLDGLQNLLPYGATQQLQTNLSSLLHAYKRSELHPETGLGIFSLSATLTDQAEPSESLLATAVWQTGLFPAHHLLCTDQLDAFRRGHPLTTEQDIVGKPGAYLTATEITLPAGATQQWHIVADVNQDSAALVSLMHLLEQDPAAISQQLENDITTTTAVLQQYVAAADGLQKTAETTISAHHFANVMFNVMRGGIFIHGYQVAKDDLLAFLSSRNRPVLTTYATWLAALPDTLSITDLYGRAAASGYPDLVRLCYEYMPLTFSRRHGDPSRPWNRFAINLKHKDGSPRLDYQGNWRDIFQNWEPLALAFPSYVGGFIAKFLNATTADGYNPYRVTRAGIEWEVPEPENPWANIGYWSDHQIIYLQKLLEIAAQVQPHMLAQWWQQPIFAYANVPYRLKPYRKMLADWYNTIEFDWESERAIETAVAQQGTDARLHRDAQSHVLHVTLMEKLLVLLLAKLTNLVPEGGIWMNTQRPEWNDANNALVGKGLSVVTVGYLRRFIAFWRAQLAGHEEEAFLVNTAVAHLFTAVHHTFATYQPHLPTGFSNAQRHAIMDELGDAATRYRTLIYDAGIPTTQTSLKGQAIADLLALAQAYLEQTLRANRRDDDLYHAYNTLRLSGSDAAVEHLYLMLEGQVAVLSSGMLTSRESLALLRSLRHSPLYRADQHTYMLYPYRQLPGFLQKNHVPAARVAGSALVAALAAAGDRRLLVMDKAGDFHFNGRFRNVNDVRNALDTLTQDPVYAPLVATERQAILDLFEETFNHRAFTGRSGTFFAYEGLGSIYWHMVSKLLLAAQECYLQAVECGEDTAVTTALADAYYDIRDGLGYHKSPANYGAFPTDPYSHTPWGSGARQPGMTGQVKEEILTRWGELGVSVREGQLRFMPTLLRANEFVPASDSFAYVNLAGQTQTLPLPARALAFTFCQTPIVYVQGEEDKIEILYGNGRITHTSGCCLDSATSQQILGRTGQIRSVQVTVKPVTNGAKSSPQ